MLRFFRRVTERQRDLHSRVDVPNPPHDPAFLAPDLLGGARTVYAGSLIQGQFAVARDIPFGSAVSFLLTLLVIVLLVVFRRPLRAAIPRTWRSGTGRPL